MAHQLYDHLMNVNLTDELERYVRGKLDKGHYNSASEVVREALREKAERERRSAIEDQLQTYVIKGIDLGPPDGVTEEEWDRVREATREGIRRDLSVGIAQLDRGEGIDGDEALRRMRRDVQDYKDAAGEG